MRFRSSASVFRQAVWMLDALLWFVAALAPLMVLLALVIGFDQVNRHRGLLADLQAHGVTVWARIDAIQPDEQHGSIYLFYQPEPDVQELAVISPLEFYPAAWWQSLRPGEMLEIIWIPPGPYRHAYRAVPRAYAQVVRRHSGLTRDMVGMFLFFLAVVIVRPHFVFLGFLPLDLLFNRVFSPPGK